MSKRARQERRGAAAAKRMIREVWGDSLDLLAGLLSESRTLGERFSELEWGRARKSNDPVFYVLMHLHANACLVASEVLALLDSGHAGGAIARWRSLHEVGTYAAFILKHGAKTAERYVRHSHIKDAEDLPSVDDALEAAGDEGFSPEEREMLAELKGRLLKQYGEGFQGGFGWAKEACAGKGKLSFDSIASDLDPSVPKMFYRIASHLVHPTWKGIIDNPGAPPDSSGEPLLAGSSEYGLWLPAMLTARSIYGTTVSFLSCGSTDTWRTELYHLSSCVELVCDQLREARDEQAAPAS